MPRKIKCGKNGGGAPAPSKLNMFSIFIGIFIFILIVSIIGVVIYLLTRVTCSDQSASFCSSIPGKELKKFKSCDGDCTTAQCCEYIKCEPPPQLNTTIYNTHNKQLPPIPYDEFNSSGGVKYMPKSIIECSDKYAVNTSGIKATRCDASGESYTLDECKPLCVNGYNPVLPMTVSSRTPMNCNDRKFDDSVSELFDSESKKKIECNKYYSPSNKFCILDTDGLDHCKDGESCIPT